jgi:SAM-dependent methyltransferase
MPPNTKRAEAAYRRAWHEACSTDFPKLPFRSPVVANVVPAHRINHPLSRVEVDAVLHALDPAALRSAIVRRVGARGFVTEDVLARIAVRLERHDALGGQDATLVHLGARSAGIGLWLAECTRTQLIVADPDQPVLDSAMHACGAFDLEEFPSFQLAPFDATRLATGCAQAVVSVEALYLAQYPNDALCEMHRILDHGGVLLFDAYVAEDDPNATGWVTALQRAGFDVLDIDDQTEQWRRITREQHLARLEYQPYLIDRLGHRTANQHIAASRSVLSVLDTTRRVELLARRRRFGRSSSRLVLRTPIVSPTVRR